MQGAALALKTGYFVDLQKSVLTCGSLSLNTF